MQLFRWLKNMAARSPRSEPAEDLYDLIVRAARQPDIYRDWAVPDTIDGRFDVIVLHLAVIYDVLLAKGDEEFARRLQEIFIRDMDRNLREMGVGDMSVGKRIKDIGAALLGRQHAYSAALADAKPAQAMSLAVAKNVFRSEDNAGIVVPAGAEALTAYIIELKNSLGGDVISELENFIAQLSARNIS